MLSTNQLRQVAARTAARDIGNVEIEVLLTYLLQLFHEKSLTALRCASPIRCAGKPSAVAVFEPSPLAGEGVSVVQQNSWVRGLGMQPSPLRVCLTPCAALSRKGRARHNGRRYLLPEFRAEAARQYGDCFFALG